MHGGLLGVNPMHALYEPATTENTELELKEWFLVVQGE